MDNDDEMLAMFMVHHSSHINGSSVQCGSEPTHCAACEHHCKTYAINDTYTEMLFHLNKTMVSNNTRISVAVFDEHGDPVRADFITVIIGGN